MGGQPNPKIVGATIIGFALIAGAYTVSNFGEPRMVSQPASAQQTQPAPRISIEVVDNDANGIEDWRDVFVTSEVNTTVISTAPYVRPDTVTGNMGINFIDGIISSKLYAPFSASSEEVVTRVANSLDEVSLIKLYETKDITIIEAWEDEDIVNYANTVAATIYRHNVEGMDNEIRILYDIYETNDPSRIKELEVIRGVYQSYRDDTLQIPVPAFMAKEHLDLINTYQAIYEDLTGMTQAFLDPAVTLVHVKRYREDAEGFRMALANMYSALLPHGTLFEPEDPALLFVIFSPDYKP